MKISVLIFAYNRKEYLLYSVKSALTQTLGRSEYEIIVVKNFKDNKIDKFLTENNIKTILKDGTIGEYIKEGITQSNTNIICFLDDDDLFEQNKLETVINKFNDNSDLCYFHNNFDVITDNNSSIKVRNHAPDFNMSCISINLDKIDISKIEDITTSQDTFLYLKALDSKNKIICSVEKLTEYRVHNSTSNSYTSNLNEFNSKNQQYIEQILGNFKLFSRTIKSKKAVNYLNAQITNWTISLYTYNFKERPSKIINFLVYNNVSVQNTLSKLLIYTLIRLHFKKLILYIQKMRYNNQIRI
jgi:glycosyltransferase involved in cell wall biosynthesis